MIFFTFLRSNDRLPEHHLVGDHPGIVTVGVNLCTTMQANGLMIQPWHRIFDIEEWLRRRRTVPAKGLNGR
ncbi:hypothetical protein [Streptomyces sp. NPDC086777]|uniref:hypothetical protein n=1 Tax=Streptomyces sp. NPDC086777 TaxID=3154866 RepID=UPI00344FB511